MISCSLAARLRHWEVPFGLSLWYQVKIAHHLEKVSTQCSVSNGPMAQSRIPLFLLPQWRQLQRRCHVLSLPDLPHPKTKHSPTTFLLHKKTSPLPNFNFTNSLILPILPSSIYSSVSMVLKMSVDVLELTGR